MTDGIVQQVDYLSGSLASTRACMVTGKLDRYAALHAQTYGEAVDAATLIPHMLEAFMARDRGFHRKARSASAAAGTAN